MGFGDPYHKHPLKERPPNGKDGSADCSYCELPIIDNESYGCNRCDYYIHKLCANLPKILKHSIHEHPLTLSPAMNQCCDKCQKLCLDCFVYHCQTCQVTFHLKCLFALEHGKHEHPLIFGYLGTDIDSIQVSHDCNVCGFPIIRFCFACTSCGVYIHHECSLIKSTIKHWHVHELEIRYDFPSECDQIYCDLCEDKDGKELDRTISYYYCKKCDYIAHLHCCLPEPKDDGVLIERYTHEHPFRLIRKHPESITTSGLKLHCDQCDYVVDELIFEYPSLINHPLHPQHNLTFITKDYLFKCTECEFALGGYEGLKFTHPYFGNGLEFRTTYAQFRCDACGEPGKGSRMIKGYDIDFHLECFALPGKLEDENHHHPLYLSSNPMKLLLLDDTYTKPKNCVACDKEIDLETCMYRCLECDYVAHLSCGASDLLSTLRSSIKNGPDFCAIIKPDQTSFELQIAQTSSSYGWPPAPLLTDMEIEGVDHVVQCPRCSLLISTRDKYS